MSQNKVKTRTAPPTAFKPGQSGNPGGRPKMDPKLRDALISDTPKRYERLQLLSRKAEKKGDLKTAAHIELSLLKKVVPDTTELLVGDSDPSTSALRTLTQLDPKKMTEEELEQIISIQRKQLGK